MKSYKGVPERDLHELFLEEGKRFLAAIEQNESWEDLKKIRATLKSISTELDNRINCKTNICFANN